MQNEDNNDIFKYSKPDMYFGDNDGDSWNSTPLNWNMQRNFQQSIKSP